MSTTKPWYLAGPMTGIPQFNFPLFESEAKRLRAMGMDIISPHEQDSPAVQEAAWASPDGALHSGHIAGETWGDILARDVKLVADEVCGILVLPDWNRSRGARLETFVAYLCNKPIKYAETFGPVHYEDLIDAWEGSYITRARRG
jgi:hypothetical protein